MFRSVRMPDGVAGRLLLHSMPGRREAFDVAIEEIKRQGVTQIICLAPLEELRQKAPAYARATQEKRLPCAHEMFPIVDFNSPELDSTRDLVRRLGASLRGGDCILIHCGAGIGRTGTIAICVLLALGVSLEKAKSSVRDAGSGPETPAQVALITSLAADFHTRSRQDLRGLR